MSNKIPWQPIPEDYDFENDFEAPWKLFWCKGPYGEGHWSNDELWEEGISSFGKWFENPKLTITHWAWINGPKEQIETPHFRSWGHEITEPLEFKESTLKVGEPNEEDRRPLEQIVTEANRKAVKKEIERIKSLEPIDWPAKFKESGLKNSGTVDIQSDEAIWDHVQKVCEDRLKRAEESPLKVGEPKE